MADVTKKWERLRADYIRYIKTERRLSANTVEAYVDDYNEFMHFVLRIYGVAPEEVNAAMISRFMQWLYSAKRSSASQARRLSGIKSLYNYLLITERVEQLPTESVDAPKAERLLPDVLSVEEIDALLRTFDITTAKGCRDSAIVEVLYSTGLRVTELVTLRINDLFFGEGYVRVIGKGDKQRLVPISSAARDKIQLYMEFRKPEKPSEPTLFLNNRGKPLTRVMVFTIIRQVQELLGHESISTTEVYTHLDRRHLRSVVEDSFVDVNERLTDM